MVRFEIKDRDAGARLCRMTIGESTLETPLFLPVFNPNVPTITPKEMEEEFGLKALITNAYIIYKNGRLREEALNVGIHRMLGFSGTVFCDSGAYQTFRGDVELTQEEIVRFQEKVGADVGVMLDIPSKQESYSETRESVLKTVERAREWSLIHPDSDVCWEGVIQGGGFRDLVKLSCREMKRFHFDMFAVGVPPRLWKGYGFKGITLQGLTAKMSLPSNKPIHAFGMGHPMVMSLLTAIGYDLYDSASYSIYARDLRYMTELGTRRLEELVFLPCNCPVCEKHGVSELWEMDEETRVKTLAKHNLYAIQRETRIVKQAIRENRLWELVQQRARAHPSLLEALVTVLKRGGSFFQSVDPVSKRSALFYSGSETKLRPELRRALRRVKERLGTYVVPSALKEAYPFGQSILLGKVFRWDGREYNDLEKIRVVADFQFGKGVGPTLFPEGVRLEKSKVTGRMRRVWLGEGLLATQRAENGLFALKVYGARLVHKALNYPRYRVVIVDDEEVHGIVGRGGNVFPRFILACDKELVPREEALVVDSKDRLLAVGDAVLSGSEMREFQHGMAVNVREGVIESARTP